MTIRKTLLIAFLLVSVLPAVLLTSLAFFTAGSAMRDEIGRSLQVQSTTVSDAIDKLLFERLQNAISWRQLEVMQEIQVGDIDKRLAKFLSDLKTGYRDTYLELSCTDPAGRIIASSDPAEIGRHAPSAGIALQGGGEVMLENLILSSEGTSDALPIRTPIPWRFKTGQAGELRLLFNWNQVYRILDQAAQGGRLVLLLDGQQRVIAASSTLRKQGLLLHSMPKAWTAGDRNEGSVIVDGSALGLPEAIIGFDRSHGFPHFSSFGWTTVVIQPSSQALVPVQHMASVFLVLFAFTSILALALSFHVAARIARPIAALTLFTRHFMRGKLVPPMPTPTVGEVGELTTAFLQTVEALEQSRHDLVRASKLAVLGELSAAMAHEVRTPLGILRSSAQMLAREPNLSPEGRELTGFIESEIERLNRLVSTLLDSARPRPPNFQPCNMHDLVRHVLGMLAGQTEQKGLRLVERLEAGDPFIECDAEQMTQVLLNLVLNAIQILPAGGRIEIACHLDAETLRIDVADNGPGIPADERAQVFDSFFSRRVGGIGLGLAIVQQIVAAHGGTITAGESTLGGALFSVNLPRKPLEKR